ncbi:DNA adenine methylase [Yersinia enterocolitica]
MDTLKKQSIRSKLGLPHISADVSPFRYPGGKGKLSKFLALFIVTNKLEGCKLVEPFCGGAGGTLPLLLAGLVDKLVLNDINPAISAFWWSIKNQPNHLIKMIEQEPVDIDSWLHWREIYFSTDEVSKLEKGFSAFFLNRTNRSGMLHAGPIGGRDQSGEYKIACRFTRKTLIDRIERLVSVSSKIVVTSKDAVKSISRLSSDDFIYADPPYVKEGRNIYSDFCFTDSQHVKFANALKRNKAHWLLSYDDHKLIHELYSTSGINIIELSYAINKARLGRELLIASSNLRQPELVLPSSNADVQESLDKLKVVTF